MPCEIISTDEAKRALSGLAINNASDVEIRQTLCVIYTIVGLRPQHYPTMAEDTILMSFIRSEYGLKTLDELLLAFKLAIKGELEIEDVKVYDQFTCEYLARVMTAYRKWLKSKSKEMPAPAPKMILGNVSTSQAEKMADIEEWESKDKKDINFDLIPPYLYDYLVEFKKIPDNYEEPDNLFRAAKLRRRILFQDSLSFRTEDKIAFNEFEKMFISGEYSGLEPNRIKLLAKKIMVFDYLNKKKSNV